MRGLTTVAWPYFKGLGEPEYFTTNLEAPEFKPHPGTPTIQGIAAYRVSFR